MIFTNRRWIILLVTFLVYGPLLTSVSIDLRPSSSKAKSAPSRRISIDTETIIRKKGIPDLVLRSPLENGDRLMVYEDVDRGNYEADLIYNVDEDLNLVDQRLVEYEKQEKNQNDKSRSWFRETIHQIKDFRDDFDRNVANLPVLNQFDSVKLRDELRLGLLGRGNGSKTTIEIEPRDESVSFSYKLPWG